MYLLVWRVIFVLRFDGYRNTSRGTLCRSDISVDLRVYFSWETTDCFHYQLCGVVWNVSNPQWYDAFVVIRLRSGVKISWTTWQWSLYFLVFGLPNTFFDGLNHTFIVHCKKINFARDSTFPVAPQSTWNLERSISAYIGPDDTECLFGLNTENVTVRLFSAWAPNNTLSRFIWFTNVNTIIHCEFLVLHRFAFWIPITERGGEGERYYLQCYTYVYARNVENNII